MGTVILNKVSGEHGEKAIRSGEEETLRLEGMLSRYLSNSEISRINSSAGIRYEKVSNETYEVIHQAVEYSKYCQGCFDITIGPLVDLWKTAKNTSIPPDITKINLTLPLVNYGEIVLDPYENAVYLKKVGQSIDLGGIGKGFAADKVMEVFRTYSVTSAFTNFGGNVATIGAKSDGSPWCIGIQHPRQENKLIGVVYEVNKSVVTSGDYQRYFIDSNGKRYHHILDPSTGYPSKSELISVTIVTDSSMAADALSTMLFVAGIKRGIELLKYFPGTEAILIDINLIVYVTQGLKDCFQAGEGINVKILN
jgi:thiamine biosynthesis lipoprotein